jgi:hypothetical protein
MSVIRKTAAFVTLIVVAVILSVWPTVGLGQSKTRPDLTFTCMKKPGTPDGPEQFRAVIFIKERNSWRRIDLPENYLQASWQYAGRVKGKSDVWAIAQFGQGDIGPDLEIAHSLNGGRTWKHHSLPKNSRFSTFQSFSMDSRGRGSLTIQLEDNMEQEQQGGYYTYQTRNNGGTWSRTPRYSKTAPPAAPTALEEIPMPSGGCVEPGAKQP